MKRTNSLKPKCKFGSTCYRKNSEHLKKYSHEISEEEIDIIDEELQPTLDKKDSQNALKKSNSSESFPPSKKAKIDDFFKPKLRPTDSSSSKSADALPNKELVKESDLVPKQDSPKDVKENIKSKFLVDMPDDFYDFFNFCESINKSDPLGVFQELLDLQLVGPFLIMDGSYHKSCAHLANADWLTNWRYFHDPPELTTVVRGDSHSQFHLGYFRDDPKQSFTFVVSAETSKSGTLTQMGDNLFAAFSLLIAAKNKPSDKLKELHTKLKDFAEAKGYSLLPRTPVHSLLTAEMIKRKKSTVCPTMHGAGLMIPVDANDIGYRPVPSSHAELGKVLGRIVTASGEEERNRVLEPLDELITYIQFANDEGDYGEGIELGLNLLAFHPKGSLNSAHVLNQQISSLLSLGYQLAGRLEYQKIIEEHMLHRKDTDIRTIKSR